jgi:hypothetical protein
MGQLKVESSKLKAERDCAEKLKAEYSRLNGMAQSIQMGRIPFL